MVINFLFNHVNTNVFIIFFEIKKSSFFLFRENIPIFFYLICQFKIEHSFNYYAKRSDKNYFFVYGKVGVVMCLESPSKKVAEIISYKSNSTSPMPLLDSKGNQIITDCKHSDVKVGQIYKDKGTLISVMARFAIEHFFNFYTKRSDKKRYVLFFM